MKAKRNARVEGSRPRLGADYIDEGPIVGEAVEKLEEASIVAAVVSSVDQYERAKGWLSKGELESYPY